MLLSLALAEASFEVPVEAGGERVEKRSVG
jgi:hypothetical protein